MTKASNPDTTTTTTAVAVTKPNAKPALPRIKLSGRGIAIDHPDPQAGERLLADALGAADRDAMDGLLIQLVKLNLSGGKLDDTSLAFMLSMAKSIAPKDAAEAMLVAQMVSVHVLAMKYARRLAHAEELEGQDSAARAFGRLARVFPAQMEALARHRSHGGPTVTVQNVSVADGGNAIVGHVTQHASVIVSDAGGTGAASKAAVTGTRAAGEREAEPVHAARAERA